MLIKNIVHRHFKNKHLILLLPSSSSSSSSSSLFFFFPLLLLLLLFLILLLPSSSSPSSSLFFLFLLLFLPSSSSSSYFSLLALLPLLLLLSLLFLVLKYIKCLKRMTAPSSIPVATMNSLLDNFTFFRLSYLIHQFGKSYFNTNHLLIQDPQIKFTETNKNAVVCIQTQ